jgi:hypothetical protein
MALIPENVVDDATLAEWYRLKKELDVLKAKEMLLRTKIFGYFFTNPVEGTNTAPLAPINGVPYALKGVHTITRNVDNALLTTLTPVLLEKGLSVDKLIERKPSLVLKEYRLLTAEERTVFDQVLEIKPGSPALSIVEVKKATK